MTLRNLIIAIEKRILMKHFFVSSAMAVPKKRRSKTKGRIRLSNWKRKSKKAAEKAYSSAKTFFANEKKASSVKESK
jgi:ribosomal protein L32